MTLEEARKIAATISSADGGCFCCVTSLMEFCQDDFPEFIWEYNNDTCMVEVSMKGGRSRYG